MLGIPLPPRRDRPEHGLWACHLPAINAFLAVANQWRSMQGARRAHVVGLDYAAVRAGLDMAGITLSPDEWADFRVIEGAASAALNGD